jgi:hypothetical protein
MGHGIGVAHDPSDAVRRRHLPALRAGRNEPTHDTIMRMFKHHTI